MSAQQEHWRDKGRAQRYARWRGISSRIVYASFARKIAKCMAPLPEEAIIVDLGTGPGLLPIELHKLWPQAKIIGVDPSAEMLDIARKNANEAGIANLETRVGTAEEIPIASNSVDLVVTQSSFHEWENPQKGLAEIFRILRPGGCLILKDYNRAWLSGWKRKLLGLFHYLDMFKFTFEEVAGLLREAGFGKIKDQGKRLQLFVQASKPTGG
ncbi:MAG: class I SAM-dependent methyltransferase [Chloroflexi bacterium]|nr:class I SAM-dependent methyltransferase [Chloroflexota bacterium]